MFLFLFISFIGLSFDRLNIFKYCLISCILHECGHIIAHKILTGYWPQITVGPFGFTMKNNVSFHKYYNVILFAGPFVNLLCALIGSIFLVSEFTLNRYIFTLVNCAVFIFNMMPVYYLDGGQILYNKSRFYQKKYRKISAFSLFVLSVMVCGFTGEFIILTLPVIYYIVNISNDI